MSLAGKTLVFTGTLAIDRKTATQQAEAAGAKVTGAVSAKTTHLVTGPGAGSNVAAAEAKGVTIWTEDDMDQLRRNRPRRQQVWWKRRK